MFFLFVSFAYALTPEEQKQIRDWDSQAVAQINANINTQANRIETSMANSINSKTEEIKSEIFHDLKNYLKAMMIGLCGVNIIALALFKMIDLKLTHNKSIKRYKDKLDKKLKELEEMSKKVTEYKKNLDKYRNELEIYAKNRGYPKTFEPTKKNTKLEIDFKNIFSWKIISVMTIIILIMVILYMRFVA